MIPNPLSLTVTQAAKPPVIVVTQLNGIPYSDPLAVRLAGAGQVAALLRVAETLARQELAHGGGDALAGVLVYALSATVELTGARCWPVFDAAVEPDEIPDGGAILHPAPAEPDEAAGNWAADLELRSNGVLSITGSGDVWAEIDLYNLWEQLR